MPYLGIHQDVPGANIKSYRYKQGTDTDSGATSFPAVNKGADEVRVYHNGLLLKLTADYSFTTSAVTISPAPADDDEIQVDVYTSMNIADTVSASDGGTFTNAVTFQGGVKSGTVTAQDGTSAVTIADSTGNVAVSSALDVSAGTLTTSTTQKEAIVDGGKGNLAKADVGLGNVDNTADADKPVSTATTTALNNLTHPAISSITYPTESGVVATALEASGGTDDNVMALTITTAGTGYSGSGTLSATGGAGNGFTGTYTESGGAIATVTITDPGQEYTSTPTIVVSGSTSGTAAVITASLNETLLINGTNLGTASVIPTVQIEVGGSYVAFAGTVSCNASGTVVTCANVTKRASGDNQNLKVTHGSNNLIATTTVNFSADPSFTTASGSLGGVFVTGSAMTPITITAGDSVSWYEGATTMPTWMTHFADGDTGTSKNLTGTPTNTGTSEVQSFNIIIRDSENQSHNRDFSLTVADYPTGGTIIEPADYEGDYRSHTFLFLTSSTTPQPFIPTMAMTVDILIIAGGGGGGINYGAGGGAGGMRIIPSVSLAASTTYNIRIGAGGDGKSSSSGTNGGAGENGDNSSFIGGALSYTATGGGGGGGNATGDFSGTDGGSGGGMKHAGGGLTPGDGINDGNTFGTATYQGHDGGLNSYTGGSGENVSGGGGAGAAGAHDGGSASVAGAGGAGRVNYYRDGDNTGTDAGIHIFAGGGGAAGPNGNAAGGSGGGAAGSANGTSGTGGGGGGNDGDGGSGIVVIRYAI